ncbi:MAG: DNA topoisomerase [Bifidobacterium dentium]
MAGSKDFGADGKLTAAGAKDNVVQLDETQARALAQSLEFATFTVTSMESKPYRRRPLPPFTTSTLQQTAGNRLSMSSRQTMRAAQGLYENGYITYMRTDSVTLSQERSQPHAKRSSSTSAKTICRTRPKQYATKTAGAQEAHECISRRARNFRDLAGNRQAKSAGRPAQAVHADLAAHACLPDGRRTGSTATV